MINITVVKSNSKIITIQATGHSGYAEEGQDIVCAAVSTLTQALINGLVEVVKISPKYVIDEDILLKNGAEISNKTYGTLVGYDTGVRKINASLDGAFTAYIGHSGATQEYDGVEAHQKGGLIGGTLSLYKGVFFSATTLSAGALETESKSMFGKDD